MSEWEDGPHLLTHSVDTSWYNVRQAGGMQHFGKQGFNQPTTSNADPLWFSRDLSQEQYWPFKTQWQKNYNGPIAISPNHELSKRKPF